MISIFPRMARQWRVFLMVAGGVGLLGAGAQARTWQKVVTPRFTLITDSSDYASRELITDFSDYLGYLDKATAMEAKDLRPLTIILFANEAEFHEIESTLPNGKTVEQLATEQELYAGAQNGFGPNWAVISAVTQDEREETKSTVFYAGAEWYLGSLDQPLPLAVEHGLASVLASFQRGGTHGIVGKAPRGFAHALFDLPSVRVGKLLRDNDFDGIVMRNQLLEYNVDSWVLIHYLMYSKAATDRGAFGKFWHALRAGRSAHDALIDALGAEGAANIDLSLRTYIRGPRLTVQVPLGDEKNNHDPYQPASEFEVQLAFTKAAMSANQFTLTSAKLSTRQYEVAMTYANAAVAAANGNPEAYDVQAQLLEANPNDIAVRRAAVKAAIDHGSKNAYTVCAWARYLWNDAGGPAASAAASRQAVNGAERAANADLNYQPAFDLMAQALRYADHIAPADEKFLAYARQRFPRDRWILVGIATFERKRGNAALAQTNEAAALAENPALDPEQRAEVNRYLSASSLAVPAEPRSNGTSTRELPASVH